MPLPASLNVVTVTGSYTNLDGSVPVGKVTFTPDQTLINSVANEIVIPKTLEATLDGSGDFTIQVPASDDPDFQPQGVLYTVKEDFPGGRTFQVLLPIATPNVDLADIIPAAVVGQASLFLLKAEADIEGGYVGISDTSQVSIFGPDNLTNGVPVTIALNTTGGGDTILQLKVDSTIRYEFTNEGIFLGDASTAPFIADETARPEGSLNAPIGSVALVADGTNPKYNGIWLKETGALNTGWSQLLPPGIWLPYGGSVAPDGWLLCDGSAVSRTTYARLFAVIGTTFGVGDGVNTFNLPNPADRVVLGKSGTRAAGTVGGSNDAVVVSHSHSHAHGASSGTESADHSHSGTTGGENTDHVHAMGISDAGGLGGGGSLVRKGGVPGDNTGGRNVGHVHGFGTGGRSAAHTHGITVNTDATASGVSGTNANLPQYVASNYIIKT